MTALPGSPAIQNAIPIPYYGTNVFAAPGLGMIGAVIMFVGGLWWLRSRAAKAALASEGYGHHHEDEPVDEPDGADGAFSRMPLVLAILPLILVVGVNAVFTYLVFPRWDMAFLAARFPDVAPPGNMAGLWALIIALAVACAAGDLQAHASPVVFEYRRGDDGRAARRPYHRDHTGDGVRQLLRFTHEGFNCRRASPGRVRRALPR